MMRSIHLQGYKVNQDVERDLRHLCFEPLKVVYCLQCFEHRQDEC